jgi:Spy/CpxP family protein refolding chaperone
MMENRMSYRLLVIALFAVLVSGAPLAASAQPPPGAPPGPPGGMRLGMRPFGGDVMLGDAPGMTLPLMLRHADLTAEQQTRVHDILSADRERLHTLLHQLDTANDALAAKVVAPGTVNAGALEPDVEQIARLRQDLMEQGLKTALAVRAVLTSEQLAKVAAVQTKLQSLQQQMHELLDGK